MKIGVFTIFCIILFLVIQRAATVPLAYFAFFPLGFLVIFYFYDSKEWPLFILSTLLMMGTCLYHGLGVRIQDTEGLIGAMGATFVFLFYYRKVWGGLVKEDTKKLEEIGVELNDLKGKHSTRVESLLHLEKQVASLINLFEIARDFNECLDFKETVQILFKKVLPELSFEQAELALLAPGKKPPEVAKAYVVSSLGVEERDSFSADAVEKKWLDKLLVEKNFISEDGLWLFPLILEGEFNGYLAVQGPVKEDLAKFEVLASQLALQVRKVRLYEKVHELSIIDGLTGVFVRRHFLERFEEEIKRAIKQNFPLSVLMLDIDHFKRYNDEFGHLVGDATLKECTQIIRANIRNVDILARYGGEEFAIIFPETKEEGAVEVAERIRSAVARKAFRVYDEETRVTVSIGISVFPQDISEPIQGSFNPDFLFELLQKGDRALYRAKEEGRNRVIAYHSLGIK